MKRSRDALARDLTIPFSSHGYALTFASTWGLFSPDRIDDGSALLLDHLDVSPDVVALDLGCGYGVLGLTIAARAPQGTVHLVDKDFVAVEYTQKNIAANHLANAQAYLSNGLSRVPKDARFTLIVSNLPAKVGRELYDVFFADAYDALAPGGAIVVVTVAGLKEAIKRSFREVFGNSEKLAQRGTHVVTRATRP